MYRIFFFKKSTGKYDIGTDNKIADLFMDICFVMITIQDCKIWKRIRFELNTTSNILTNSENKSYYKETVHNTPHNENTGIHSVL